MSAFRYYALLSAALALSAAAVLAAGKPVPVVFLIEGGTHGLVVGASSGSRWLDWGKAHVHIKAGERYRFFTTSGAAAVKAVTKPALSEASGAAYNVTTKRAGEKSPELGVPASVRWKLMPRPIKVLPRNDASLRKAVIEFLRGKGLADPEVEIARVRQVDLEGDGAKETLIETHSPNWREHMRNGEASSYGEFSLVLLRQSNGKINKVGGEIQTKAGDDEDFSQYYELAHVVDLNGDGRMEIVVQSTYYEGGGADVYEWKGGTIRRVLSASDGL